MDSKGTRYLVLDGTGAAESSTFRRLIEQLTIPEKADEARALLAENIPGLMSLLAPQGDGNPKLNIADLEIAEIAAFITFAKNLGGVAAGDVAEPDKSKEIVSLILQQTLAKIMTNPVSLSLLMAAREGWKMFDAAATPVSFLEAR